MACSSWRSAGSLRNRSPELAISTMRLLILLCVFLFSSLPAEAQRRHHAIAKKGDVALVAQIDGLSLRGFSPVLGGVGLRVRLADQTVVGLGFGLGLDDADNKISIPDREPRDVGRTAIDVRGLLWMEQHIGSRRRTVSPFIAGGVTAGYSNATYRSPSYFQTCDAGGECTLELIVKENETSYTTVGGGIALGAEVRVARGVTLGGAYSFGVEAYRQESRADHPLPNDERVSVDRRSGFRAGTQAPTLNLSVYF